MSDRLLSLLCIGESRFQAKHESGKHGTVGIHSWGSYDTIKNEAKQFTKWLKTEHREIRSIKQIDKALVIEYLDCRHMKGYAPKSMATSMSSLNKIFNLHIKKADAWLEPVKPKAATKGRSNNVRIKNTTPYSDHMMVLEAFGARAMNVRNKMLKISELEIRSGRAWGFIHEKGGRQIWRPAKMDCNDRMVAFIKGLREKEGKYIFDKPLSGRVNAQKIRRDYALAYYNEAAGKAKNKEKIVQGYILEALRATSRALGHNRVSVVLESYLPDKTVKQTKNI